MDLFECGWLFVDLGPESTIGLVEGCASLASCSGPHMGPSSDVLPSRVLKRMAMSARPMESKWSPLLDAEPLEVEQEARAFEELKEVQLRLSVCACCKEEFTWPVEVWQLELEKVLPTAFELQDCNHCNISEVNNGMVTIEMQLARFNLLKEKRQVIYETVCGLGFEQKVELIENDSAESKVMKAICEALTTELDEEWVSTGTFVSEGPLHGKSYIVESAR